MHNKMRNSFISGPFVIQTRYTSFYMPNLHLDSAVVKTQKSAHGAFLTYVVYHHRETTKYIKKNYDETVKKALNIQS